MATITGTGGNDVLTGTNGRDTIFGRVGNDTINGRGANDQLYGGAGNDRVIAGDGNDLVWGDYHPEPQHTLPFGNDFLDGGAGNDQLDAGPGDDVVRGGNGRDWLYGQDGNDILDGGLEINELHGGNGNDTLIFNPGAIDVDVDIPDLNRTVLDGGGGYDILKVTNLTTSSEDAESPGFYHEPSPNSTVIYAGQDGTVGLAFEPGLFSDAGTGFRLFGIQQIEVTSPQSMTYFGELGNVDITVVGTRSGDDFLGGDGDETLVGGGGNDSFSAGNGTDLLVSEPNDADRFSFHVSNTGHKEIWNFNGAGSAGGDHISIPGINEGQVSVTVSGGTTIMDWGVGEVTIDAVGLAPGVDYQFWFNA